MKYKIEFNMPEEREEFDMVYDGWKYKAALIEISEAFYKDDMNYDQIKQKFFEILNERGIILC